MPQRMRSQVATAAFMAVLMAAPLGSTSLKAQTQDAQDRPLFGERTRNSRPLDPEDRTLIDDRASDETLGNERLERRFDPGFREDSASEARNRARRDGLRGSIDDETLIGSGIDRQTQDGQIPPARVTPDLLEPLDVAEDAVLETEEEDPYAAIGIRVGSFLLFPELLAETVYQDNVFLSSTRPESDWALELTPSLILRSDWNRHSLEAGVRGDYSFHERFKTEDDETFAADVAGQLDIRRNTNLVAATSFSRELEDRGSSDFPSNAADRAESRTRDASLEGNHTFNRVTVTLRGAISDIEFDDSTASDGSPIDNTDRNYTEHRVTARAAYEFQPDVQVFVETSTNEREFERAVDNNGALSGSSGYDVQAGLSFKLSGKLVGEASAGYAKQTPEDPGLPDTDGLIFNAALEWEATGLTTFRLDASSDVVETTQAASSGSLTRSATVSVEHRPRRNIILGASLGYEREEFSGSDSVDEDWTTELSGEYLFTPSLGVIVTYEHQESLSSTPGDDYSTDEVRMGVRVRR